MISVSFTQEKIRFSKGFPKVFCIFSLSFLKEKIQKYKENLQKLKPDKNKNII